jgi:hypothetical protein
MYQLWFVLWSAVAPKFDFLWRKLTGTKHRVYMFYLLFTSTRHTLIIGVTFPCLKLPLVQKFRDVPREELLYSYLPLLWDIYLFLGVCLFEILRHVCDIIFTCYYDIIWIVCVFRRRFQLHQTWATSFQTQWPICNSALHFLHTYNYTCNYLRLGKMLLGIKLDIIIATIQPNHPIRKPLDFSRTNVVVFHVLSFKCTLEFHNTTLNRLVCWLFQKYTYSEHLVYIP